QRHQAALRVDVHQRQVRPLAVQGQHPGPALTAAHRDRGYLWLFVHRATSSFGLLGGVRVPTLAPPIMIPYIHCGRYPATGAVPGRAGRPALGGRGRAGWVRGQSATTTVVTAKMPTSGSAWSWLAASQM